jgi:hypothetical protein
MYRLEISSSTRYIDYVNVLWIAVFALSIGGVATKIAHLDTDIERLRELQVHYQMRAVFHESQVRQWKAYPNRIGESERAVLEIARDRKMEKRIVARLKFLEDERKKLQEHELIR